MTPKIRILPENLCNQIAAGEVVERPASVVKELIENALDADATEITIEVEGGGRKLIRVTDNGDGMGKDDIFLCLERHGTSKISTSEDLFHLNTLGFRGEALPSIAAVSRVTLRSRNVDSLEGWELYVEGGTIRRAGAIGLPIGTAIEVRDLFFNTPARRKFLRKDETELGHIAELVTRLALSSPEVQFRLFHNQRPLIDTPRQPRLVERVAALLGRPLLADLATVDFGDESLTMRGFISRPELNRATSGAIYTYINGRYIRDRVVQHAIVEGVRQLLPRGRYPVAILFLTIPSDQVDVNVHPTKHEVRFSNQHAVHDFIVAAIRSSLRSGVETAAPLLPAATKFLSSAIANSNPHDRSEPRLFHPTDKPRQAEIREAIEAYVPLHLHDEQNLSPVATQDRSQPEATAQSFSETSNPEGKGFYSRLAVIGQYKSSYILAEDELGGLVLIDQHAAHERIGFERLRKEFRDGVVARQMLLFPQIIEFDFKETSLVVEQLDLLARLGFELEHFGARSFALKAVPELLNARTNYLEILRDIAGELAEIGVSNQIEAACEQLLVSISCHGMVRANHHLSRLEIEALLRDLDQIDFNACCPHGRPIHKRLASEEIARMFRRSA